MRRLGLVMFVGLFACQTPIFDVEDSEGSIHTESEALHGTSPPNDATQGGGTSVPTNGSSTCTDVPVPSELAEWDVLLLDHFCAGHSDVEGRLAAGADIEMWHYSVGRDASGLVAVAGGDAVLEHGTIYGELAYGGDVYLEYATAESAWQGSPVDFGAAGSAMRGWAADLSGLPVTGSTMMTDDRLVFSANASAVFSVTAAELDQAWELTVDVPAGESAIILVDGSTVSMHAMTIHVDDPGRVLFVMQDAVQISLMSIGLRGSLLAPNAMIDFDDGRLQGQLWALSFDGDGLDDGLPDGTLDRSPFIGSNCEDHDDHTEAHPNDDDDDDDVTDSDAPEDDGSADDPEDDEGSGIPADDTALGDGSGDVLEIVYTGASCTTGGFGSAWVVLALVAIGRRRC